MYFFVTRTPVVKSDGKLYIRFTKAQWNNSKYVKSRVKSMSVDLPYNGSALGADPKDIREAFIVKHFRGKTSYAVTVNGKEYIYETPQSAVALALVDTSKVGKEEYVKSQVDVYNWDFDSLGATMHAMAPDLYKNPMFDAQPAVEIHHQINGTDGLLLTKWSLKDFYERGMMTKEEAKEYIANLDGAQSDFNFFMVLPSVYEAARRARIDRYISQRPVAKLLAIKKGLKASEACEVAFDFGVRSGIVNKRYAQKNPFLCGFRSGEKFSLVSWCRAKGHLKTISVQ